MTTKTKSHTLDLGTPRGIKARAEMALRKTPRAPHLRSEQDGRLFAAAVLITFKQQIKRENKKGFSPYTARADEADTAEPGALMIFRASPQSTILREAFDELRKHATREAVNGFFCVFTDFVGGEIESGGALDLSAKMFDRRERSGYYQPWGSVAYRDPKAAREAIAKGESVYKLLRKVK